MVDKVLFSSNSDIWATPQDLFDKLNDEFCFTLDPCCNEINKKCDNFFTEDQDGLLQDWGGFTVFCNPPYSKISLWVEKCFSEWVHNDITIVLLLPSRTDTKWFHNFIYPYCDIRFIKGRLRFNNSKNVAPFPSMICIFNKVR